MALVRDGRVLCVARPSDPAMALATAGEALAAGDAETLRRALDEQPHTIIGFLGVDGRSVLDENGSVVGEVQLGDSFVSFDDGAIS